MMKNDPATAAIEYSLKLDWWESKDFLEKWLYGEFPEIREQYPDAPESIYIGADPLYEPKP